MLSGQARTSRLGRAVLLGVSGAAYRWLARPLIFRSSAQDAHDLLMRLLCRADSSPVLCGLLGVVRRLTLPDAPVTVGGATLAAPLILAAGLVKGDGFESEAAALAAVNAGRNIMPGWRSIPRLVGLVEFGSFTRWPRLGNPAPVVWRDVSTRSTQNRVGLKNPGAAAAARFLARHAAELPVQFGINVAVSPGVDDPGEQASEITGALAAFVESGVCPTWFTLNLSCPNTEDDPTGYQTAEQALSVCRAAAAYLAQAVPGPAVPLWVKVSPALSSEQYRALLGVCAETGVRAVIATNTLPQPAPNDPALMAGVGGGRLHTEAVKAAAALVDARRALGCPVDVIGCGGVENGATFCDFARLGVKVVQYWSALIYRGPLAAASIGYEARL